MAAVRETIVREYFERHGFLVRQRRKYVAPARAEEDDLDFFEEPQLELFRPKRREKVGA